MGVLLALALTLGSPHWDGSAALWGSLAFAVLVLSIGGTTLLIWLMHRGETTRTAALLLAVPPWQHWRPGPSLAKRWPLCNCWALCWPWQAWRWPGAETPKVKNASSALFTSASSY